MRRPRAPPTHRAEVRQPTESTWLVARKLSREQTREGVHDDVPVLEHVFHAKVRSIEGEHPTVGEALADHDVLDGIALQLFELAPQRNALAVELFGSVVFERAKQRRASNVALRFRWSARHHAPDERTLVNGLSEHCG